ncbi:hypothetical protein [Posidoniimonas corsicana]|uniref:hypothetical protein n=1 Tax=Posidoniimonas corsicana TaxID=1938618 RepID=UPI0011B59EFF|nr:hypothetical protein [Posidoniimonas corsicana]
MDELVSSLPVLESGREDLTSFQARIEIAGVRGQLSWRQGEPLSAYVTSGDDRPIALLSNNRALLFDPTVPTVWMAKLARPVIGLTVADGKLSFDLGSYKPDRVGPDVLIDLPALATGDFAKAQVESHDDVDRYTYPTRSGTIELVAVFKTAPVPKLVTLSYRQLDAQEGIPFELKIDQIRVNADDTALWRIPSPQEVAAVARVNDGVDVADDDKFANVADKAFHLMGGMMESFLRIVTVREALSSQEDPPQVPYVKNWQAVRDLDDGISPALSALILLTQEPPPSES